MQEEQQEQQQEEEETADAAVTPGLARALNLVPEQEHHHIEQQQQPQSACNARLQLTPGLLRALNLVSDNDDDGDDDGAAEPDDDDEGNQNDAIGMLVALREKYAQVVAGEEEEKAPQAASRLPNDDDNGKGCIRPLISFWQEETTLATPSPIPKRKQQANVSASCPLPSPQKRPLRARHVSDNTSNNGVCRRALFHDGSDINMHQDKRAAKDAVRFLSRGPDAENANPVPSPPPRRAELAAAILQRDAEIAMLRAKCAAQESEFESLLSELNALSDEIAMVTTTASALRPSP